MHSSRLAFSSLHTQQGFYRVLVSQLRVVCGLKLTLGLLVAGAAVDATFAAALTGEATGSGQHEMMGMCISEEQLHTDCCLSSVHCVCV